MGKIKEKWRKTLRSSKRCYSLWNKFKLKKKQNKTKKPKPKTSSHLKLHEKKKRRNGTPLESELVLAVAGKGIRN